MDMTSTEKTAERRKGRQHKVMSRLEKVLNAIGQWSLDRAKKIKDVICVLKNGQVEVFVVTKAEEYDYELSKQLTEFSSPYILRSVIGDATLVPSASNSELRCYFDPRDVLMLHLPAWTSGEATDAHGS